MTTSGERRPNIIFIYSDQLRADSIGCAGNRDVRTPHVDRLAGEGVRFENAFVSYPLCTPFRASLLTGKYAHATGVHANHFPIPTGQPFLSSLLKDAGYRTGYVGKWHLYGGPKPGFVPSGPDRLSFDHFVGFNRGHEYTNSIFYRDTDQPYHCKRYEPDYQTDHLIEFMEGCIRSGDGNPFFGYICFGPPHFPMDMPGHWKNLYDPNEIELPHGVPNPELQRRVQREVIDHEYGGDASLVEKSKTELRRVPPGEPETEEEIRKFLAEYYGMVTNVDFNVGRILNWLDSKDVADDTMVVFFSDHGDMMGQHGHYCGVKRRAYKSAMQVPLVCRYPERFPGGHVSRSLVDVSVDTMPTILELCGIGGPGDVHGTSYLPLLDGGGAEIRDHVFYEHMYQPEAQRGETQPKSRRGVRTHEWLYVRERDQRHLLFDLVNDSEEETNLVHGPEHTAVMDAFDVQIEKIMRETDDDWLKAMKFPPPGFVTHEEGAVIHRRILANDAIEVP